MLTKSRILTFAAVLLACGLTCAHHPGKMEAVRSLMASDGYQAALDEFSKMDRDDGDVLYLLEWGLLLHYAGEYAKSNEVFERAEILSEDLYTKSISREAAALVTSDLALEYVPKPHEQVLTNYFRALNYIFLGDKEGALVECRKAVDKLMVYSDEDKRPYRRDAFIEYLTGILYEWDGQVNDAFISYRNAVWGYWIYEQRFGIAAPLYLTCDALRTARSLGFTEEADRLDPGETAMCEDRSGDPDMAKVVVFLEQGFVPGRQAWSVNIPILKSEAKRAPVHPYEFSMGIHSRIYGHTYDVDDIAYFLRVALPVYPKRTPPPDVPVLLLDGHRIVPHLSEDVFAIAKQELDHDMPRIVAKTLARALIKYKATDTIEGSYGKLWGTIANIAAAATEQADLRTWLSLPRAIHIAVAYAEPGSYSLTAEPAGGRSGSGYDPWAIDLDLEAGTTNFVRIRVY
jgi:tetratricopeptide (TPR) repeat protein